MPNRLLDRQVRLLDYLTSGAAIFGDESDASADRLCRGSDLALLRLEARFSHEKRMKKIAAVFARTIALLGDDRDAAIEVFARTCPPTDISRIANARQFHDFLLARWRAAPPVPPYLPDVAAVELACAKARVARPQALPDDAAVGVNAHPCLRRHPAVILVRCDHDIRQVIERSPGPIAPPQRSTLLAVRMASGAEEPYVLQLEPELFDLLQHLDEWVDASAIGASAAELDKLIDDLAGHELIEVRR